MLRCVSDEPQGQGDSLMGLHLLRIWRWGLGSAVEHFVKFHCVSKATLELTILPQLVECYR